jgi:hypothetical protein
MHVLNVPGDRSYQLPKQERTPEQVLMYGTTITYRWQTNAEHNLSKGYSINLMTFTLLCKSPSYFAAVASISRI